MFGFFSALIDVVFRSDPEEEELKRLAANSTGENIDDCVIRVRESETWRYNPAGTNRVGDVYDREGKFVGNIRFNLE